MTLQVQALGTVLDVDVQDDGLRDDVHRLLDDLRTRRPPTPPDARVTVRGRLPWTVVTSSGEVVCRSREEAVTATFTAVNLGAVEGSRALSCHCAVLERNGRLTVVPAASGAGKSTLTGALLQRGWGYVSDEALCVDWAAQRWMPYRRPLALSAWSRRTLGAPDGVAGVDEHYFRAGDLSGLPRSPQPPRSLTPGHIVLLERADAAPSLEPVHRSEALEELLRRSFTAHRDAPRALAVLGDIVRASQVWRLRLGDPAAAADVLTSRLVPSP